jgi:DNA-binding XRE family transcriptional regulator
MNLREIREVMGWEQADCAYLLGLHQRTISRIEAGHRVELTDEQEVKLRRMRAMAERRQPVSA